MNISVLCFPLQLPDATILPSYNGAFYLLQLQEMQNIRICICGLQIIDYMDTDLSPILIKSICLGAEWLVISCNVNNTVYRPAQGIVYKGYEVKGIILYKVEDISDKSYNETKSNIPLS